MKGTSAMEGDNKRDLVATFVGGKVSRRDFIRRALALGISSSAVGSILAACGGAPATSQAPTSAPAQAPVATEAPTPTTAPPAAEATTSTRLRQWQLPQLR